MNRSSREKREFYARRDITDRYDSLRFGSPSGAWVDERELAIVRSLLPTNGLVLDAGCGTGRLSLSLSGHGYRVTALDSSRAMLEAARAKPGSESIDWLEGDAFALPFRAGAFDAAVALRVALHFAELCPLLAAMARAVRPGGIVVFDTYNWSPRALVAWRRNVWGERVYAHRREQVCADAAAAGLRPGGQRTAFLFSPYLYSRLPPAVVRGLDSLETHVPAAARNRVFWRFQRPADAATV
jgi:SAM-dependent methyltransferase